MGNANSIIETGVDKLVNLINSKEKVAADEAAKELGVSTTVVMEWSDFLEEEGIINIEYKFTKPFLIARKTAKKDVQEKAKEFEGKKDVFIRKAEVSLNFLEKESVKLKSLKEEFEKIKKDLGIDIGGIKDELAELQKYEQLKIDLDKKVEEQKKSSMSKLQEITEQISKEKNKYQEILEQIKEEESVLEKDKGEARSIEESEKLIKEKLDGIRQIISSVEERAKLEEESIKSAENHIQELEILTKTTRQKIEKEKSIIEPLLEESKQQTEKINEIQDKIIKKITDREKKLKGVKEASKRMEDFFKKKLGVLGLIEKVNQDRNELEKDLQDLMRTAKSFQLSSKSLDTGTQIANLEKKFEEVDKRKNLFETELEKLSKFFK